MLIDLLISKFDMLSFLQNSGYNPQFIGGRTQYFLSHCPNCQKENHCGVNLDTKSFGCFKCHIHGDFIKLLQLILDKSFIDVLDFLKTGLSAQHVDINFIGELINNLKMYDNIESKVKPIVLPEDFISLRDKRIPYLDKGRKYPIPQEQVNYYNMGVCLSGKYKDRLIVCDIDDKQQSIYWVARDISGVVPKSMKLWNPNSEQTNIGSSDILFNFFLAKNYDSVIITEGVFDALYVGNNAVATYGTGLKKNHIYWLLRGNFKDVVLLYDSDVKDEELEKSGLLLSLYFNTRICKLPSGDPDEWPREKLTEFILKTPRFIPTKLSKIDLSWMN